MNPRTEMKPPTGKTDGKETIQQRRDNLESVRAGRGKDSQENLSCCSKRTLSRGQRWEAWQALIQVSTLTWRTDGREGGLEAGGRVGGHHRDLGTWWHHSTPQHMVEKKGWFHISGCGNSLGEGCSRRKNFWAGVTSGLAESSISESVPPSPEKQGWPNYLEGSVWTGWDFVAALLIWPDNYAQGRV